MITELCLAIADDLLARMASPGSGLPQWVEEVTQPPLGLSVDGSQLYSGCLLISKNQVLRSLLVQQAPKEDMASTRENADDFYPDRLPWPE